MNLRDGRNYNDTKIKLQPILNDLRVILDRHRTNDHHIMYDIQKAYDSNKKHLDDLERYATCPGHFPGTPVYIGEAYGNDIYRTYCTHCNKDL